MGLEQGKPVTWVSTFGEFFTTNAQEGQAGARRRETKTGNTVWYFPYKNLVGHIVAVKKQTREWEKKKFTSLLITLEDKGEEFILTVPWMSNAASCFLLCMENIDYARRVRINISMYNDKQYLWFQYDDGNEEKIERKYTKENPNGKPEWKWVKINGEDKPDRTEEMAFLENILVTSIQPAISNAKWMQDDGTTITATRNGMEEVPSKKTTVPDDGYFPSEEYPVTADQEEGDDDLPF